MPLYRIKVREIKLIDSWYEVEARSALLARDHLMSVNGANIAPYDEDSETVAEFVIKTERVDTGDEMDELIAILEEQWSRSDFGNADEIALQMVEALVGQIGDDKLWLWAQSRLGLDSKEQRS